MSSKRSRVVRSSSVGDYIGLFNEVQPIESAVAAVWEKKPSVPVPPEEPRRSILTMGSPLLEKNNDDKMDERLGVFLEACYLCKKRLPEDKDVFMYGDLRAFCTLECRDEQIALDEKDRKPSPKSTASAIEEPVKRGFGSQVKRQAVARFK